jgi:UDP-N-acetylglucosamine pyrophosphorylase
VKTSSPLSKYYIEHFRPGKSVLQRLIYSSVRSHKNKKEIKYHTIFIQFRNRIEQNSRKKQNQYLYIHDRSLPWLGILSSIKSDGVKPDLWDHTIKYHTKKNCFSVCDIEILETKVTKHRT